MHRRFADGHRPGQICRVPEWVGRAPADIFTPLGLGFRAIINKLCAQSCNRRGDSAPHAKQNEVRFTLRDARSTKPKQPLRFMKEYASPDLRSFAVLGHA